MGFKTNKLAKVVAMLSLLVTLIINALANILPFNGKTTAQVSGQYPVYFTPAAYVFSIWSLIYVALIAYTVYLFFAKGHDEKTGEGLIKYFIVANIANSIWMLAWHYDVLWLSVILMIVILVSLVLAFLQIQKASVGKTLGWKFNLLIKFPFSIYLGWICVATIANVSAFLYALNWNGFGISGAVWCAILIVIATILALVFYIRHKEWVVSLVVVWAVLGISVRFPAEEIILFATIFSSVVLLTTVVSGLMINSMRRLAIRD